jgi:hypothetical protein
MLCRFSRRRDRRRIGPDEVGSALPEAVAGVLASHVIAEECADSRSKVEAVDVD